VLHGDNSAMSLPPDKAASVILYLSTQKDLKIEH